MKNWESQNSSALYWATVKEDSDIHFSGSHKRNTWREAALDSQFPQTSDLKLLGEFSHFPCEIFFELYIFPCEIFSKLKMSFSFCDILHTTKARASSLFDVMAVCLN